METFRVLILSQKTSDGTLGSLTKTERCLLACFCNPFGESSNRIKNKEKKPLDEQTSGWLAFE